MSLFIGMLAFTDAERAAEIRIGVLLGSLASALAGYLCSPRRHARAGRTHLTAIPEAGARDGYPDSAEESSKAQKSSSNRGSGSALAALAWPG